MGPNTIVRKVVDYVVLEVEKLMETYWSEDTDPKWTELDDYKVAESEF